MNLGFISNNDEQLTITGSVTGISRGKNKAITQSIRINSTSEKFPQGLTFHIPFDSFLHGLTIAKIAYCYAVLRLGINGFIGDEMRSLLKGKRNDVFNFVGNGARKEKVYPHLHEFEIKEINGFCVVNVWLFSSTCLDVYEVVVGWTSR